MTRPSHLDIITAPPTDPQHVDNFHIYRGTGSFTDCFFDNWDGIVPGLVGAWTSSMVFLQTLTGSGVALDATFNRCIQRGGATVIGNGGTLAGAPLTYFCDAKTGTTIAVTFTNCVLDVGTGGKYSSVAGALVPTAKSTSYNRGWNLGSLQNSL